MKRMSKLLGIIAFMAVIVSVMGCMSLSIPTKEETPSPIPEGQSKLIFPNTIAVKVEGKNLGSPLPSGNGIELSSYNIAGGKHDLELTFHSEGGGDNNRGRYTVRGIKFTFDFIPGRTYTVVGEGKWITDTSYQHNREGVRVWILDSTDDSLFNIRNPEKESPNNVCFSPDDTKIVFCVGKKIYVHNAVDGTLISTLLGHSGIVTSVKFSSDGEKLFSTSADKTVRVWDLQSNAVPTTIITSKKEPSNIAWSEDASLLAMMIDNKIEVYDTGTKQLLTTFTGHNRNLVFGGLTFNQNGSKIVSYANPTNIFGRTDIIIWESKTGKQIAKLDDQSLIWDIAWQPFGNRIAVAYMQSDPSVKLFDENLQNKGNIKAFPEFAAGANLSLFPRRSLLFKPDGTEMFCITRGHVLSMVSSGNLINMKDEEIVEAFACQSWASSFYNAAYSSDGSRIALLSGSGVKVWNSNLSK